MKLKAKVTIIVVLLIVLLLAWAPWMDNQAIHDKVLKERGWKDGTITTPEHFENLPDEVLQEMLEESREKGVEDGILICDYNVMWAPFGRWVASCEGGYYVTFYGSFPLDYFIAEGEV